MMQPASSPLRRLSSTACGAIDKARRFTLNVLFICLVLLFVVALFNSGPPPLRDRTTLVIAPEGPLVEQLSTDPVAAAVNAALSGQRVEQVRLRDLLHALRAAKSDKRIERIVLRLDDLKPQGFASLRDVAAAIDDVRKSGKEVIAFAERMTQYPYQLAAHATTVYLDPKGDLAFNGIADHRLYYGEALDRFGVDVHVIKAGEFKSAAEPYFLAAASPASKEADALMIDDLWQRYLSEVAQARGIEVSALRPLLDQWPARGKDAHGDFPRLALDNKLVDGLKTEQDLNAILLSKGVADDNVDGGFRQIGVADYLAHLEKEETHKDGPAVAVVVAAGEIKPGKRGLGEIGGDTLSAQLRQARLDDDIKAVVLRVDSPGGEGFASEQIRREVVALRKAGKPVAVSMGDYAASGGYMISADADRIFADASTLTGSIGVFAVAPNYSRALGKLGVHNDGVGSGPWANAYDNTRTWSPEALEAAQAWVDKNYRDFVATVATGRHRHVADIEAVASGRVWTGSQAKERGLVDELGDLQAAIDFAATRARLKEGEYDVRYVEESSSLLKALMTSKPGAWAIAGALRASGLSEQAFVQQWLKAASPQMAADLAFFESSLSGSRNDRTVFMHCMCAVQ